VRPILEGNYIIPKTIEYIKRNASAKKPFFVYVGYSEVHPLVIGSPNFVGKSEKRGGLFADIVTEMDYRVGQILDAVKELASTITPWSFSAATTRAAEQSCKSGRGRTGRGAAIF
jgi:hypothetical protein